MPEKRHGSPSQRGLSISIPPETSCGAPPPHVSLVVRRWSAQRIGTALAPPSEQRTTPVAFVRILFIQFSGLLAALTFANQFFAGATAAHALSTALVSALTVYAVLVLGDIAVQRLLELAEPAPAPASEKEPSSNAQDHPGALAA